MNKKHLIIRIVIMLLLVAMMLPTFAERSRNESMNKDVIFAVNYNNAHMVLSEEEFDATLKKNKEMGVSTLLVGEESVNSLINAGFVTGIKYNVLCHKYDDESEAIIKQFANDKKIHNDSYVLITKRPEAKAYLNKWIPAKYSKDEFVKKTTPLGANVYMLYEGVSDAWKVTTGFDEKKIEDAYNNGFEIVLSMMLGGFSNTEYIGYIGEIIDKYDVKFINLKEDFDNEDKSPDAKKNYEAVCKLIEEKKLYLIVTENQDQLSNQKPIGYTELVNAAGGRVLRGYETVDFNADELVETRYHQIINSVADRNIRFVVINQLVSGVDTFEEKSNKTNKATEMAIAKLEEIGYNTENYDTEYDYTVNRRLSSAIGMALMIIMGVTLLELLFSIRMKKLELLGVVGAVLSVGFSFLAPETIISLYPTLFAALAPCFAFTAAMAYVKSMREKLSWFVLLLTTAVLSLVVLALCGMVQSSLLAGLDYYINSLIFRGIKLSLILPIAYSAVAYGIMFVEKKDNYVVKTVEILNMEIKVYWMIVAAAVGAVAAIYLIRSGNVTSISPFESFMRNSITELMTARPRTKEFLVGWPCLALFVYYIKNTGSKLFQWCFAVGSSILFASVINSFCHVFTSVSIIYSRVINGLIIAMIVTAFALVINAVIIRAMDFIRKKYY